MQRNTTVFTEFCVKMDRSTLCDAFVFLPRDTMQSAVMPQQILCLSVRLFIRYIFHTRWNTSKKNSQQNRLTY